MMQAFKPFRTGKGRRGDAVVPVLIAVLCIVPEQHGNKERDSGFPSLGTKHCLFECKAACPPAWPVLPY